jgi:hypothetical protein
MKEFADYHARESCLSVKKSIETKPSFDAYASVINFIIKCKESIVEHLSLPLNFIKANRLCCSAM